MSLMDNFISGLATAGGVAIAKGLAATQSANIKNTAPYVGGALMAYAIGKYQDANGKMGSIMVTGLTGLAGGVADAITSKKDKFTSATQTVATVGAATAANYACEKFLNYN